MKFSALSSVAVATLLALSGGAQASLVVMDQIGPDAASTQSQPVVHSQKAEASFASVTDTAVDNFSLSGTTRLTQLDAVVQGFGGFVANDFSSITGWYVQVYSSLTAAASNQTGDIASVLVAPGAVSLATGHNGNAREALVSVPIDLSLASGGYYIALVAGLDMGNTRRQIGVTLSTYPGSPGDNNGYLANPGGGGGFANNLLNTREDLAYRLLAADPVNVPEPSSLACVLLAVLLAARASRHTSTARA